jgi:hypothetical protein
MPFKSTEKYKEYQREYRKKHDKEIKDYKIIYCKKNKDYIKEQLKKYRKNNKEHLKKYMRNYYENNKQRLREYYNKNKVKIKCYQKNYIREYYKLHKEDYAIRSKKYYKLNKREIKQKIKEWIYKKYHTDIRFRLLMNLRHRIWTVLHKNIKSETTLKFLGCSIEFFKKYYESKFAVGMTWKKVANGEIHCDHIRPCSSFDLSKLEEQQKCFHYTNLQPLWVKDNLKKGCKYDKEIK